MGFSPEEWAKERLGPQGMQPRYNPLPPINGDQRQWAINEVKSRYGPEDLKAVVGGGMTQGAIPQVGYVNAQNDPLANQSYPMPPRGDGEPVSMTGATAEYVNQQTGHPSPVGSGFVTESTDPLTATPTQSIQQQIIQGSFFQFPEEPDASGELWGTIGEGPNGYNWNINGSPLVNPYVPGWFADQPPVLNFPPAFTESQFRARHLFGFESLISRWPDWLGTYQHFYGQALDAVEADFGGFIYPRMILCQPAGELVLTPEGYRPVETIEAGDLVKTHQDTWAPVTAAFTHDHKGSLFRITVSGLPNPIRMTADHRVWAIRTVECAKTPGVCDARCREIITTRSGRTKGRGCKAKFFKQYQSQWIEAQHLKAGDILSHPIDMTILSENEIRTQFLASAGENTVAVSRIGTRDGTTGRITGTHHYNRSLTTDEVSFVSHPDFGRFVGYWVGDGTLTKHGVSFAFGEQETAYTKDIQRIAGELWNRKGTNAPQPKSHLVYTNVSIGAFRSFFANLHQDPRPGQKVVPFWMEQMPLEWQREFILGYWRADGDERHDLKGRVTSYRIVSVSLSLLESVQRMGWRLGLISTLRPLRPERTGMIKGKPVHQQTLWELNFYPNTFSQEIFGVTLPPTRRHRTKQWIENGVRYAYVKSVEQEPLASTPVYSFRVEHPDHSYIGYGVASHNCDGLERGFTPGVDFDLEEREYDFNASNFYHWGWMNLRYGPLMAILNMNMVYPTGQMILQFPPAWIKPQMLSSQIRLVPPQGAISEVVLGPGGYMVMLVGGTLTDMPALIFVDYIAGMWPIPAQLIRAIELRLALMVFPVLSDAIAKGRADVMTTVDNVHYKQLFTTRSDVQGLTGRMTRYIQEYGQILRNARARYLGSAQAHKLTAL